MRASHHAAALVGPMNPPDRVAFDPCSTSPGRGLSPGAHAENLQKTLDAFSESEVARTSIARQKARFAPAEAHHEDSSRSLDFLLIEMVVRRALSLPYIDYALPIAFALAYLQNCLFPWSERRLLADLREREDRTEKQSS